MTMRHLTRKVCPDCGRPLKLVPDEEGKGRDIYVCYYCERDPLQDLAARRWVESPLKPPNES
ncbi:hypothetical protein JQ614_36310 [Bradyrhizobium diazoefficiens]|nr:hypothetical protein [Bradyrhizobium diazoefficiens]MBR0891600.1 hypothetical protein [Bradyrhizobium diazoefficiens]MBR0923336.1 hypothetical protein [Bradyrhizobium diazoefficiens]MBR1070682.1 hypothetical protein [Bradyrhizobium liaoningense]